MAQIRIIKKYPNRRLYDSQESRYITLAEIRKLVEERVPFQVIERRSDRDITAAVLLQVITELEAQQPRLLGTELLEALIRAYRTEHPERIGERLLDTLREQRGGETVTRLEAHKPV